MSLEGAECIKTWGSYDIEGQLIRGYYDWCDVWTSGV